MKKPSIHGSFPPTQKDVGAIKDNVDVITARRGQKCDLTGLDAMVVSNPPTQAQVEFLRAQLAKLVRRIEE